MNTFSVGEGSQSVDEFLTEVQRLCTEFNVYGASVVLFRTDGKCRSFQFGLEDEDFAIAVKLIQEHEVMP